MTTPILVSACLLGLNTRYNAECRAYPEVESYLERQRLLPIPVCPEQLAGMPTPRPSASFGSGDGDAVLDGNGSIYGASGSELTGTFIRGAEQALKIAKLCGCTHALLKERSPSCGSHSIYLEGSLVSGRGVTSALLKRHGITIISEEEL